MNYRLIESGPLPPQVIMAQDEELLNQLSDENDLLLHFYEWDGPCLTYGHFIDPFKHLHPEALKKYDLQIARRPTGGGLIFHLTDLAFSLLVPASSPYFSLNTLDNYAFVNQLVIQAISQLSPQLKPELFPSSPKDSDSGQPKALFCMARPTPYDIMLHGKKVGGAAQRRTKRGFLHQGTISLALPPLFLLKEVLKESNSLIESMQTYTYSFLPEDYSSHQLKELKSEMKQFIINQII